LFIIECGRIKPYYRGLVKKKIEKVKRIGIEPTSDPSFDFGVG
jgi:hypothetical protein